MDTIVYIDGYNLYYGCLRDSAYKWLDVVSIVDTICKIQNPDARLIQAKYFTSPVKASLASHGQKANEAQNSYHKALVNKYPDRLQIVQGYHDVRDSVAINRVGKKPDRSNKVNIWKLEEKQTDVNIALHMYRDLIVKGECEQVVLVSADTDLEPVFELIKEDLPESTCGLILPNREPREGGSVAYDRLPKSLMEKADWVRRVIKDAELEASQLPNRVPTKKTPAIKPEYW